MTVLKVENLDFKYPTKQILYDVSVTFDKPELVCILGPNGVGKTTIAKTLNKLYIPSAGNVYIDGENVADMSRLDIAKKIAYVPNSVSSAFSMKVLESILLGRAPVSGYSITEKDLEIVEKVVTLLDLDELCERDISQLSAGQAQRVTIARGLVQDPKVLILDEPTSNLDVRYQMEIMRFLKDYAKEKQIIIIMVCHDLNITAAYADRVILMHQGRIFADGNVQDVLTEENMKTVYRIDTKVVQIDGLTHIVLNPL
ncbi:MAG: ABC transporter ATP-binding protein [Thermoplasmata archaeon]|nr:ABC transporter ATP-binding protein [Thermoplasmata archaeon]WII07381.1 ABC transporter ATP-binding protein [Methanomassiliicoccales archaeon LGM-RCC1]